MFTSQRRDCPRPGLVTLVAVEEGEEQLLGEGAADVAGGGARSSGLLPAHPGVGEVAVVVRTASRSVVVVVVESMAEHGSFCQNSLKGNYLAMPPARARQDSVDRHVARWRQELPWVDPLHEQVVARLMLIAKHLARAREAGFADDDLGRASFKVLLALRRLGPPYTARPSELADQLGLSRGALSARLSPLEDDGYITRTTDPHDRRVVHVTLTQEGRAAFDRQGQHEGRHEAAVLAALSRADQKRLADLLRTMVLAIEEPDPGTTG